MHFSHAPGIYRQVPMVTGVMKYAATSSPGRRVNSLAFNGTTWVANGDYNLFSVSTDDGETWQVANTGMTAAYHWGGVVWTGTKFVAVVGNIVITSPDGIVWSTATAPAGVYYTLSVWNINGRVYIVSRGYDTSTSLLMYSDDNGTTWINCPSFTSLTTFAYSAQGFVTYIPATGKYIAASGYDSHMIQMVSSTDGRNWVRYSPTGIAFISTSSAGIVVNPNTGTIVISQGWASGATTNPYSTDGGLSYTTSPTSAMTNAYPRQLIWTGDEFLQVGQLSKIAYSNDGINWAPYPANLVGTTGSTTVEFTCAGATPDYYLAGTSNGNIIKLHKIVQQP